MPKNAHSSNDDPCWKKLGRRYKRLRQKRGIAIEDVVYYGFSVKDYQELEAGKSHTLTTLLKLAAMFKVKASALLKGIFD